MRKPKPEKGSVEWYERRRTSAEEQAEGAMRGIARGVTSLRFWRKRVAYYDRVIRKMEAEARTVGTERVKRRIIVQE